MRTPERVNGTCLYTMNDTGAEAIKNGKIIRMTAERERQLMRRVG